MTSSSSSEMETTTTTFALLDWDTMQRKVKNFGTRRGLTTIGADDVFRITRMIYKDNYLIVFFTGYLNNNNNSSSNGTELYQFYMETKCDLYSYRKCFGTHANTTCYNKCISYKTMVMPGLRGVRSERINIIKYKREPMNAHYNKFCLDSFLNDINRVHTQTNLKEGQYVRFKSAQKCLDNRLQCGFSNFDAAQSMFEIVDPDSLSCEIVPVMACYDIETYSNGQQFSNADIDPIISIAVVVKRNGKFLKLCLYHMKPGIVDDMTEFVGNKKADIYACRFDTELEMIAAFFKLMPLINMDCILDYNGDKFDMPFIIDRVTRVDWPKEMVRRCGFSRPLDLIRIQRYDLEAVDIRTKALFDKFQNKLNTHFLVYYTHVDLYQFLSTDSEQNDVENFQLNTVAQHYLNDTKVDLPITTMLKLYESKEMRRILEYNVQDCVLPIEIFLKIEVMDFMYTQCALLYLSTDDLLSNISHKVNVVFFYNAINNTRFDETTKKQVPDPYFFNKYDLSITSGRKRTFDERNNNDGDGVVVDSQVVDLTQLKRKPISVADIPCDAVKLCHQKQKCVYTGGKVLSPNPGFKKWVVTLDFNSLYLSIMMQEGICLSNVFVAEDGFVYLIKNREAINPKLLKTLLDLRTMYKKKRDNFDVNSFLYNVYDKTQNAVKRIANSIYGYFGIFFKPLANYITKIGREKLMEAIEKIEATSDDEDILKRFNLSTVRFKVIYGDTDSSFIQVLFDENEIQGDNVENVIRDIINEHVLKKLNAGWVGYKMALENVMSSLILLKKKKYCYLNSENRLKYKGWLIKKDMPIFMRKTFRAVVDSYLMGHSVACGLKTLEDMMTQHYLNFGVDNNYSNYCFSMSYNENPTGKKTKKTAIASSSSSPPRKRPITIAKHCRELLSNSGTDFLPGNGDRIPYLLVDVQGSITQKSFPLKLFGPNNRVSWLKHVGIMCTFFNELIQIFGDRKEFEYYFQNICRVYMQNQLFDVKYPVLKTVNHIKKSKKKCVAEQDLCNDDDDNDDNDDDNGGDDDAVVVNHTHQFALYKSKRAAPVDSAVLCKSACPKCNRIC
ncbi:DNA polymerase dnapol [Spodoptera exigua multiple nucleopolyhedrovirus]|nr:DNA polymerase dnapol [Spodoptera exigua multiple nucleopolyhedrovirus]CDG72570.1 DNA polymerase dnapol [Spodoptera exigua multiple nucleopolyhedrovirus]CDG72707.1 DNA polymerase dnapol [Spodoptera exigua multiple nucleopolyhedrovirus]CDG73133.1 DNA polymerase dnapol [Spodoptera exigua multiple nucleopolyhedrovirus]